MKKRVLAMTLGLCMLVGSLPATALAVNEDDLSDRLTEVGSSITVSDEAGLRYAVTNANTDPDDPTTITIEGNIVLNDNIDVPSNVQIILQGDTRTSDISFSDEFVPPEDGTEAKDYAMFQFSSATGASLTIRDIILDGKNKARLIYLGDHNTLILEDGGTLQRGYAYEAAGTGNPGGAIRLGKGAIFTMNGGAIQNNEATKFGGGIFCWSSEAKVYINGGSIDHNTGMYAGGIAVLGTCALYLNGGVITENTGTGIHGGGVFINTDTTCYLSGDVQVFNNTIQGGGSSNLYLNSLSDENHGVKMIGPFTGSISIRKLDDEKGQRIGHKYVQGSNGYTITAKDAAHITDVPSDKTTLSLEDNALIVREAVQVTLDPNTGGSSETTLKKMPKDIAAVLPENPFERNGYTFAGWNTQANGDGTLYEDGDTITVSEATTLYAQWTPNVYNITYELNDGTAGANPPTVHTYGTDTTLVDPTRVGYTFGGWFTSSDFSDASVTSLGATDYTDDITLYAQWTPNTYTISFDGKGADGGTSTAGILATYDQPVALTENGFAKDGYNFAGWATDSSAAKVVYADGATVKNLTAAAGGTVTLYAVWTNQAVLHPDMRVQTKTYNGQTQVFDLEGFTVSYMQGGEAVTNPTHAGTYDVVISHAGDATYAPYPETTIYGGLVIEKATPILTLTPSASSLRGGGTVTLTVSGAPDEGAVSVACEDCSISVNGSGTSFTASLPNETKSYTFTATYTGVEGGNYNDAETDCTVEVTRRSSGGGSSSSSSSSGTTTETVTNKDGSTTTIVTDKKTGTVTETTKTPDGVTGTVVTDKRGNITQVSASVSSAAAKKADKTGEAVTLPVEVPTAEDTDDAPEIDITVPQSAGSVKVEIPVEDVTPGTVAVIVGRNGSERIVATSVVTADGIVLTVSGSETVKVIDNAKPFADVPASNTFYSEIASMSAREIMVGKTETVFDLYAGVTLNQIANVSGRIAGAVSVDDYQGGLVWAQESGLPVGNVQATRGDVLRALYVAAGSPVVEDTSVLNGFKDAAGVPADLLHVAAWAVRNGIMKGTADGLLNLSVSVTRGQAAALAGRTLNTLA